MSDLYERYGPCAVIAGGSHGLGGSFAEQLAEQGFDLILGARTPTILESFAADLRKRFPKISVKAAVADLSKESGIDALLNAAKGEEVGLFIHNAGTGSKMLPFLELPLSYHQNLVSLNATSMLTLAHHFALPMVQRKKGGMIIVGSLAGIGGQYGLTTYSAVKSFSRVFCEGFWFEMKQHGVDVLALTPGGIETPSRQRDFPQVTGTGMSSGAVAREGLANLANGPVYFPGSNAEKAQKLRTMDFAEAVEEAYHRNAVFRDDAAT
jgi:uncharacterized protein